MLISWDKQSCIAVNWNIWGATTNCRGQWLRSGCWISRPLISQFVSLMPIIWYSSHFVCLFLGLFSELFIYRTKFIYSKLYSIHCRDFLLQSIFRAYRIAGDWGSGSSSSWLILGMPIALLVMLLIEFDYQAIQIPISAWHCIYCAFW